ncbi:MAG: hypothetical protein ACRYGK_10780 [Janthinobacterium lividum]
MIEKHPGRFRFAPMAAGAMLVMLAVSMPATVLARDASGAGAAAELPTTNPAAPAMPPTIGATAKPAAAAAETSPATAAVVHAKEGSAAMAVALPESITALVARYPAGSIDSNGSADAALAQVNAERLQAQGRYAAAEQVCYGKFFATRCLDVAKEQRRESLVLLRNIEVQANATKRRLRADERDAALEKQRQAEVADAPRRASEEQANRAAAVTKAQARAKRLASDTADAQKRAERDEAALARRAAKTTSSGASAGSTAVVTDLRAQSHLERQEKANAAEAANAGKRADNVKAFEEKQTAALARQKEVAEKKALKEKQRQEKEAKAKAEASDKAAASAKPGA